MGKIRWSGQAWLSGLAITGFSMTACLLVVPGNTADLPAVPTAELFGTGPLNVIQRKDLERVGARLLHTNMVVPMKPRFGEPDYGYEALVLSYSGYYLAVRSPVVVFNAHQGRLLGWIPVHFRMFNSSALSICPNERYLAFSEYKDNTIPIVDLATGQILQVIEVPQMYSRICLFTPQSNAVLWQGYSGLVDKDVIMQPLGTEMHQRFAPCNIPIVANGDLSLSGNWLTLDSCLYHRDEHHNWKCSTLQFCSNNLTASSISPSERLVLYVTDEKLILVETLTATVCMEIEARHKPSESDEQSNRSHGMPCRRGFRSAALSPDETWLVASEASA
ncbi:MAG: hypothetical protein RMJ19_12905 [Gemmatales bacterium]|nr:hypothetical protein [Gemmatales bacterium]MDW8176567.1 hypothetical protein [Gemmatales bacterium]